MTRTRKLLWINLLLTIMWAGENIYHLWWHRTHPMQQVVRPLVVPDPEHAQVVRVAGYLTIEDANMTFDHSGDRK